MTELPNRLCTAVALLLCLSAAYKDYRSGVVPNSWLLAAAGVGIAARLVGGLAMEGWGDIWRLDRPINVVIALLVGYGMWMASLWAAGDAKLFATLSLLVPFSYYDHWFFPYFPSLALLINIFLPAGSVLAALALAHLVSALMNRKPGWAAGMFRNRFDRTSVMETWRGLVGWLSILIVFGFFRSVAQHAVRVVSTLASILVLLGLYGLRSRVREVFRRNSALIVLSVAAVFLVASEWRLLGGERLFAAFWRSMAVGGVALVLFRLVHMGTELYLKGTGIGLVKVKHLRQGMVLPDHVLEGIRGKVDLDGCKGRLRSDHVQEIREHLGAEETLGVYSSFPFAPFILLGLLITLATRTSLSHMALEWLRG